MRVKEVILIGFIGISLPYKACWGDCFYELGLGLGTLANQIYHCAIGTIASYWWIQQGLREAG